MKVVGKLIAASPVQEGVSRMGNPYKRCDVILAFGENFEDKISATVLNENVEALKDYDFTQQRELYADVQFVVRDSYNYSGRKFNEMLLKSIELVPLNA